MNFLFLGYPASGKTTQAKLLAKTLNCDWLSSGELVRRELLDKTETQKALKAGELAPQEAYVRKRMIEQIVKSQQYVLDGFPRTVAQFYYLNNKIYEIRDRIRTILLHISFSEMIKRLEGRGRRFDKDGIARKLEIFEYELPVLTRLLNPTIIQVGNKSIEDIHIEVMRCISAFKD